jgi:hypothetical protein
MIRKSRSKIFASLKANYFIPSVWRTETENDNTGQKFNIKKSEVIILPLKLDDKLVIGVSSRALFDLEAENKICLEHHRTDRPTISQFGK